MEISGKNSRNSQLSLHLGDRHGYQPQGAIPERDQARALDYRYRLRVRGERAGLNIIIGAQGADKLTEHLVRVGATVDAARDKSTRPAAWRLRDINGTPGTSVF